MSMLIQKLNVHHQRLSKCNSIIVNPNSLGHLYCQFNFITSDWEGVSVKMANFSYRGRNFPVLINDDNMCEVPPEVIKPREFSVSVFGGGITTNTVNIEVEDSDTASFEDENISLKCYNEIINKLSAQTDDLNEVKAEQMVSNEEDNATQLSANTTNYIV